MTLFANGHSFGLALRCCPPQGQQVPFVAVGMEGPAPGFQEVIGKVDTGAFRTMLDFATARALGIEDPEATGAPKTAKSASGHDILYYEHLVSVRIDDGAGQSILFPLRAGFSDTVKRNLFGIDWLRHLCLAVDRQSVHFLRD